jgi:hypothetical protein
LKRTGTKEKKASGKILNGGKDRIIRIGVKTYS